MSEKRYAWDSEDYAKHSAAQFAWAKELVGKLGLRGDERLLDIGCGDGKATAMIASMVPGGIVVGIDNSPDMIALARKQFPESAHPRLRFDVMDARDLRFQNEFDVAFSNAALHWIRDHRPVLAGVRNSLVQSGRLLFQMAGRGNAAAMFEVADRLIRAPKWQGYFRGFGFSWQFCSAEEYRPLLDAAGLRATRVELFPKIMEQNGRDGLAGWVRTTWLPYTDRAPADLRESFIAELVDGYLALHPTASDGKVRVQMMRLEVEAQRVD